MPKPSHPDAYPTSFPQAAQTALSLGELCIPSANPEALRAQFYGYFRALRKAGQEELANALTLSTRPGFLILRSRDSTPEAREVEAALRALSQPHQ